MLQNTISPKKQGSTIAIYFFIISLAGVVSTGVFNYLSN